MMMCGSGAVIWIVYTTKWLHLFYELDCVECESVLVLIIEAITQRQIKMKHHALWAIFSDNSAMIVIDRIDAEQIAKVNNLTVRYVTYKPKF